MNENERKGLPLKDVEVTRVIHSWWEGLDDARGDRASLRRCRNPVEVFFCQSYHRLLYDLLPFGRVNREALALVAGVLSHVKEDVHGTSFPAQMAMPKQGGTSPRVNENRFRRLIRTDNDSDLYHAMIRIVDLVNGQVNIADMSASLYWWHSEFTKKNWAFAYYETILQNNGGK